MTTTTMQSVIRIGDSSGVTLPAKELKRLGIKTGDKVKVSFEPVRPSADDDIMQDYAAFKAQYGKTLKNLADR